MSANAKLTKVIAKLGDLPAMPEIVAEVLRRTEDHTTDLSEVSDIIQGDPALTAKILKVSNSPYYGMRQVVGTLKLALVILGVREIRNIVLGISVLDSLRDESTKRLLKQQNYWKHSAIVAGLSKRLSGHLKLKFQGEDFISGLLHDIGKMVMWRQLKEAYEEVYKATGGSSSALCEAEVIAFGFDHADAAAALGARWNLPQTLVDAMRCHHGGEDRALSDAKDPRLAAVVRIANLAARDDWSVEEVDSKTSCADEGWSLLTDDPELTSPEGRAALLGPLYAEILEMPTPSF